MTCYLCYFFKVKTFYLFTDIATDDFHARYTFATPTTKMATVNSRTIRMPLSSVVTMTTTFAAASLATSKYPGMGKPSRHGTASFFLLSEVRSRCELHIHKREPSSAELPNAICRCSVTVWQLFRITFFVTTPHFVKRLSYVCSVLGQFPLTQQGTSFCQPVRKAFDEMRRPFYGGGYQSKKKF